MSSVKEYIRHLHTVHVNALTEDCPAVEPPTGTLKLPLHLHQKIALKKMEDLEYSLTNGLELKNERMFSNYAILGDSVGAGKSLMVLAHIARLNQIHQVQNHNSILSSSSSNIFSIVKKAYTDISEAGSLIVVPHTLFRQWSDYITKQTNLKHFCIARVSQIDADDFYRNLFDADVVLISNTIIKSFFPKIHKGSIRWKRLFIDEADTIHITSTNTMPPARFYWFITASWLNLVYIHHSLYLDRLYIENNIFNAATLYPHLQDHFKSRINKDVYYITESFNIKSYSFLKDIITNSHINRSNIIVSCSKELIEKSISLPPLHRQIIWCRASYTHQIIKDAVSADIQQMLHAGDTTAALESLGVKGQDTKSLIEAVTVSVKKELVRLEKTYAFKESMEYSTPQAKEVALKSLKEKIEKTQASIKGIEDRIMNFETEVCPICYEEPNDHLITPCCSRVFCAACLLLSIAHNPECPLCRTGIHPSRCTKLLLKGNTIEPKSPEADQLPKKHDALLRLLRENPQGRFLIFSRYDNPFNAIEKSIEELCINVSYLKGSKDMISSTLRAFGKGEIQCLLLNSQFAGAGLNITSATHVVLLHAMTHEEEKQILGRSYRLGRNGPLNFIKLLNKDEDNYSEGA
jgi:SNF2 family DNA or RNA helicase